MINEVRFIPMHKHHVDDVVAIESHTSATPWSATTFINEINSPTHVLLVAVIDNDTQAQTDKVVGFTGGQLIGDELHIHSLAVRDDMRRSGIGTQLIRSLIGVGIERHATSATLEVRVGNEGAQALYGLLGFVAEGVRPKYYIDNGEDAVIMWLRDVMGMQP